MKRFDVLDHALPIHQSYMIEASAGTGKTFSIENLVTRLLIEPTSEGNYLTLDHILVVTFTKMATRDLKVRIQQQLSRAIEQLKNSSEGMPSYLEMIDDKESAIRRLSDALFTFEQAQIFTIHGFCSRMLREYSLEADISAEHVPQDERLPTELMERLLTDFVRLKLTAEQYGTDEIKAVLKAAGSLAKFKRYLHDLSLQTTRLVTDEHSDSATELFAKIAQDFQAFVQQYFRKQELFSSDDLLRRMAEAVNNESFCLQVRARYQAAIIDEFQDTDPLQWQIFHTLFPKTTLEATQKGALYLVGDPKQSIYAFRQADIYTYLDASQAMGDELKATLDTNYRAQPQLVEALNALFTSAGSWLQLPALKQTLPFQPVLAGVKAAPSPFNDQRGALHFFAGEAPGTTYRKRSSALKATEEVLLYPFVANEIRLLKERDGVCFRQCALLVSDRYQAQALASELEKWNIPSVMQRPGTVSDSLALSAWKELLRAVGSPQTLSLIKIVLGGCLVQGTHAQVKALVKWEDWQPMINQFLELQQLLEQGVMALVRRFLSMRWLSGGKTTGEIMIQSVLGKGLYRDFIQIGEFLAAACETQKVDAQALLTWLEKIPKLAANDDPRLKRPFDWQADAVQILTMHASKGLEFPIVFAMGLTKYSEAPSLLLRKRDQLLPIKEKGDADHLQSCEENDAEKLRQLYVAMTRAKQRLYVPVMIQNPKLKLDKGEASPLDLFDAYLSAPKSSYAELYQTIQSHPMVGIQSMGQNRELSITFEKLMEPFSISPYEANESTVVLQEPGAVVVPGVERFVVSYSSLAKPHASHEHEQEAPPTDFHPASRTPHTLPAGNETGLILHEIFEKITFSKNSPEQIREFVLPLLAGTFFEEWLEPIVEIVHHVLTVKLGSICFGDLDPFRLWREHEFLLSSSPGLTLGGREMPAGFIKGVIDLVFECQGKYYIVDWKSNWLGSSGEHYSPERLMQAMVQNDYILQSDVYREALKRFLSAADPRPFEEIFGGCYYVFLRGVDPKVPTQGILNMTSREGELT